jgi:endonuclease V-like protein UPF0215 family
MVCPIMSGALLLPQRIEDRERKQTPLLDDMRIREMPSATRYSAAKRKRFQDKSQRTKAITALAEVIFLPDSIGCE